MTTNQNQFLLKLVDLMVDHSIKFIGREITISENNAFDQVSVGYRNQFNEITRSSILESVEELMELDNG